MSTAPGLNTLDERLNTLKWSEHPLKDLQGVLARLGTQTLDNHSPGCAAPGHRPLPSRCPMWPASSSNCVPVTVGDSHEWALKTADLLATRSPLAMAVTLEMLRRGRHLSLEDCFAMELHLDRQWFSAAT